MSAAASSMAAGRSGTASSDAPVGRAEHQAGLDHRLPVARSTASAYAASWRRYAANFAARSRPSSPGPSCGPRRPGRPAGGTADRRSPPARCRRWAPRRRPPASVGYRPLLDHTTARRVPSGPARRCARAPLRCLRPRPGPGQRRRAPHRWPGRRPGAPHGRPSRSRCRSGPCARPGRSRSTARLARPGSASSTASVASVVGVAPVGRSWRPAPRLTTRRPPRSGHRPRSPARARGRPGWWRPPSRGRGPRPPGRPGTGAMRPGRPPAARVPVPPVRCTAVAVASHPPRPQPESRRESARSSGAVTQPARRWAPVRRESSTRCNDTTR